VKRHLIKCGEVVAMGLFQQELGAGAEMASFGQEMAA
jgi:hypothetical protein